MLNHIHPVPGYHVNPYLHTLCTHLTICSILFFHLLTFNFYREQLISSGLDHCLLNHWSKDFHRIEKCVFIPHRHN